MLSSPSGMTVSTRALTMLADALRHRRKQFRTRWRHLDARIAPRATVTVDVEGSVMDRAGGLSEARLMSGLRRSATTFPILRRTRTRELACVYAAPARVLEDPRANHADCPRSQGQ